MQREEPAKPRSSERSRRWELVIAVSIAVVSVTGAALTYLSIHKESTAVENDRRSVVDTMLVQTQEVTAETQARADGALAAQYRQLMAEAGVLSSTDANQARLLLLDAGSFYFADGMMPDFLTGTGAAAQFDYSAALRAAALTVKDEAPTIPADEPDRTATLAGHDRGIATRIALSVVGLLCVVVLLTVARLTGAEQLRRGVFAAAALGYAMAVIGAIAQFAHLP